VILESLACGTPVVATSTGGIPEIIRPDRQGLLTERREASMAAAIRAALERQWPPEELVEYARNYSWERAAAAVQNVFQSVLGANRMQAALDPAIPLHNP